MYSTDDTSKRDQKHSDSCCYIVPRSVRIQRSPGESGRSDTGPSVSLDAPGCEPTLSRFSAFPRAGSTSVLSTALIQRKLGHFDRQDWQRLPPLLQEHRQGWRSCGFLFARADRTSLQVPANHVLVSRCSPPCQRDGPNTSKIGPSGPGAESRWAGHGRNALARSAPKPASWLHDGARAPTSAAERATACLPMHRVPRRRAGSPEHPLSGAIGKYPTKWYLPAIAC